MRGISDCPATVPGAHPDAGTEGPLQARICSALDAMGVWWMRLNSGARGRVRMAPRGTPDLLCVDPYLWIEVKRPDGKGKRSKNDKTRLAQEAFRDRAKRCGVAVVRAESVGEVVAAVNGARKVGG